MDLGELKRPPYVGREVNFKVSGVQVTLSKKIPDISAFLFGASPYVWVGRAIAQLRGENAGFIY